MTKYQVNTTLSNGTTINSGTIIIPDATIPIANSTTLGGVMPVTKTDGMTQEVGVDSTGKLFTAPGGGGGGGSGTASGEGAIAIGQDSNARSDYSIAIGGTADVNGMSAIAIGDSTQANGDGATALGSYATAFGGGSTAIGVQATADGNNAIAIGFQANASTANTIVLGNANITSLQCQVQTISALSDSRVKEDVSLANTAQCLEDVNRLPVSRFKYKDFTGTHLDVHRTGFMADDVEKVFPKAVAIANEKFPVLDEEGNKVYEQEVDEKGNPVYEQAVDESGVALFNEDGSIKYDESKPVMKEKTFVMEDVKSIAMEMAIPTLWGAVQELTKRVESLKAELSLLKNG